MSLAQTPVIMLTGQSHDKIVSKARELGANGYLFKPFDWTKLVEYVVKLT